MTRFISLAFACYLIQCIHVTAVQKATTHFPKKSLNLTDAQVNFLKLQSKLFGEEKSNSSTVEIACGLPHKSTTERIIGGTEVEGNELPWQAWLIISYDDERFGCGGSLINNQWVLTAAHCVDGANEVYVLLGSNYNDLEVKDPNRRVYTSETFILHPRWDSETLAGDVALIQLPKSVVFDVYVRPICLAQAEDSDHVNESAIISGWGISSDGGPLSSVLMKAQVTVMNQTACQRIYGDVIDGNIMCTDGSGGRGTCDGDSGGPLSYVNENGTYIQVGIISFGSSSGCESRQPDGHSRIRSYVSWISSTSRSPAYSVNGSMILLFISLVLCSF